MGSGIYREEVTQVQREDAHGNVTTETLTKTSAVRPRKEPDYVKLYVNAWLGDRDIPDRYLRLFLQLVLRMTYANVSLGGGTKEGGQVVYAIGKYRKELLKACGWNRDDALCKGPRALSDCGAIRKLGHGIYQINPRYAGRGRWGYDNREKRGGVGNLVQAFETPDKKVSTEVLGASGHLSEIGGEIQVMSSVVEDRIAEAEEEIRIMADAANGEDPMPF